MGRVDLTIEICGMSGDGTIAAGGLLNQAMSKAGFSVLAFDSYPAEIRGFGRCVTRSRFSDQELKALTDSTDILISLDDEQSLSRVPFLAREATVLFDSTPPTPVEEAKSLAARLSPEMTILGAPFRDLATRVSGSARGRNLSALGVLAVVLGLPEEHFEGVISAKFKAKGEKVLEANLKSFRAGLDFARRELAERIRKPLRPPVREEGQERVMLSGNLAIAQGALDAGLKSYYGYPITPATPIMEDLAKRLPAKGGRVVQMEDEISSIGAVLGSFFAGSRAMTATSGPGFALMTELITHGVMSETPAVIVDAQRAGPSTGMPTKTEQSDLTAAVFGGPGDSPRIVIAPTNVTECYHHMVKSFQLAEKYQTPVVLLSDFYLDNRVENLVMPRATEAELADGNVYPDPADKGRYRRYRLTETGISPRAIPGTEGFLFAATGLEHTERGIPNYDPDNHLKMSRKRLAKIQSALADLDEPVEAGGGGEYDLGIISWGSTWGSALEAAEKAREEGLPVGALKITSIYPYHADLIRDFMDRCAELLIPELNLEGQLATLIGYLARREVHRLNRVTGVPIAPAVILDKVKEIIGEGRK